MKVNNLRKRFSLLNIVSCNDDSDVVFETGSVVARM